MDFPVAQPIIEALQNVQVTVLRLTQPDSSVIGAVVDRMQRKFDWKIEPEG